MARLLEHGFTTLVRACGLTDAPEVQKREMRRAFFAGAFECFERAVEDAAGLSDIAADQRLVELRLELDEFAAAAAAEAVVHGGKIGGQA